ncbi:MAG: (2Fe-2S)-binding protein [Acidimicrobiales bacterium]
MYICHCRAVTDRRICEAIESGACDPDTVRRRCGAGGACGGCLPAVRALLAHYGVSEQAAPAPAASAA